MKADRRRCAEFAIAKGHDAGRVVVLPSDVMDAVVREFAVALRCVRQEETDRLRDVVRGLEAFRAELAELIAELRGDDAPLLH